MRSKLVFITLHVLLVSCSSGDTTTRASRAPTITTQQDRFTNHPERQQRVDALRRLQAVFASGDKEKIADIFQFPLPDTTVDIYIDDSSFSAQLEQNGGKITRAMFVRYFPKISESLQIDQINRLFQSININNLMHKDRLEQAFIIKAEPCYQFYGVDVEKDFVTLRVGTNSNKDYKSQPASDGDLPENDSSICEHVLWWVFQFDGEKLHFRYISGAG